MEYYIHYVPGRIRIQTPTIHGDSVRADQFEKSMRGVRGITSVEVHLITGSSIIYFDERVVNCEQIIGILEKHGYFRLSKAETCDELIEKTAEKVLEKAEKIVIEAVEGEVGE